MAMKKVSTGQVLKRLRAVMHNPSHVSSVLHAYVIPSEDAHQSEYIADCDKRRQFVSGFGGSRGMAVITEKHAALWTDGRYFLQAQQQMDDNWTLMREGVVGTPKVEEWLSKILPEGGNVGIDPFMISATNYNSLVDNLSSYGLNLISTSQNLVDEVWNMEKPPKVFNDVVPFPIQFSGKSWQDKIREVRVQMEKFNADLLVVTALDEVAWLFNLRGSDIPYNPVFFSYAFVGKNNVSLFIDEAANSQTLRNHLSESAADLQVGIYPYPAVSDYLAKFIEDQTKTRIWLSSASNQALVQLIPKDSRINQPSPIQLMKAVKNPTEIAGMKSAHVKDALAHCEFLCWIEQEVRKGVDEMKAAAKFEELRKVLPDFRGLSFPTISSVNSNAAIIHYEPTEATNAQISQDSMYLVDSGAHYWDGTTDVTRTVHFGSPTAHQQECFTRVLKGHIGLASLVFPEGTDGYRLDSVSRFHLWEVGLEFMHGTGHGVGHFLNVHEGPAGFHYRPTQYSEGIKEGMIITIEPGYYEDGQFGIRIENVYVVVESKTKNNFGGKKFLTFEPLTLVPIQKKMIMPSLLSQNEIDWINQYHQVCRDTLMPKLDQKPDVSRWLVDETMEMG